MAQRVSAEPQELCSYSDFAVEADNQLQREGSQLAGILESFERKCSESDMRVAASQPGSALGEYGRQSLLIDEQVGEVGRRFARADGQRMGASAEFSLWKDDAQQVPLSAVVHRTTAVTGFMSVIGSVVWLTKRIVEFFLNRGLPDGIGGSTHDCAGPEKPLARTAATTAEKVLALDAETDMYRRSSEVAGIQSNCTWYAAQAVKTASNGKVDIGSTLSLGDAGKWAEHARAAADEQHPDHKRYEQYKNLISGVDKKPTVGSVYCAGGHVAFVEDVELIEEDGQQYWEVVLSEENYYYSSKGVFAGSAAVEVPGHPEVKRWRRTKRFVITDGQVASDQGEFVHLNYGGS